MGSCHTRNRPCLSDTCLVTGEVFIPQSKAFNENFAVRSPSADQELKDHVYVYEYRRKKTTRMASIVVTAVIAY